MANKVLIKKSTVAGNAPVAGDLDIGELAVNTADAKLYTKHSDGTVKQLSVGPKGDTGATGAAGPLNGAKYTFSSSTTDEDPGNGVVRYNNSTPILISYIYIDLLDANNNLQQDWINSWDDIAGGTYRGVLTLQNQGGSNSINIFRIAGAVASAGGYARVPVTHVSGTLPANGETLAVVFSATGPQGIQGLPGATGTPGAPATITVGSTTTGAAGSSATVTNSGSANAVTLNFTIPRGDTGATGSSGVAAATAPLAYDSGTQTVSTSMATNRLLGRSTAGTGVAEEISLGTNLSMTGGVLNASGSAPTYATTYNDVFGVTTTATATSGDTTITVASGANISDGDRVFGEGIAFGTTVASGGGTTSIVLSNAIRATITARPVTFYSSAETSLPTFGVRAFTTFNSSVSGQTTIFPGGTTTVTRTAGSTTATFTCARPHGLIVGNWVHALTGVSANAYTVTSVPSTTSFTITTSQSTALNAVASTFRGATIFSAYGIGYVAVTSDADCYVNFNPAMPDANYAMSFMMNSTTSTAKITLDSQSATSVRLTTAGAPTWSSIMVVR